MSGIKQIKEVDKQNRSLSSEQILQNLILPSSLQKAKGKIAQNEQKTRKTEENEQKSEVFPPFFSLIRFFLLILHPNNKSVIN